MVTRPLVVVCDASHLREASALAKQLGVSLFELDELATRSMLGVDVVVDANLRDPASVEAIRTRVGPRDGNSQRFFVFDTESAGRAWSVQADSLGATKHLPRAKALRTLQRLRSMMASYVPKTVPGPAGPSLSVAEQSMAQLFEGLLDGAKVDVAMVGMAGRGVVDGVDLVGGGNWLGAVKAHHEGTFQHCLLVMGTAAIYAKSSALSGVQVKQLMMAAVVHDVGKATVPTELLDKPGKLSESEFEVVKRHPVAGFDYLRRQKDIPEIILNAVRHHHEALDGTGYPDGLRGDAILPLTRILTVCDIYAALIERRAYKHEKTPEEAISILIDMAVGSKVDYAHVRVLAESVGVDVPPTIEDVVRGVMRQQRV